MPIRQVSLASLMAAWMLVALTACTASEDSPDPAPDPGSLDTGFAGGQGFVLDAGAAGGTGDDLGEVASLDASGRVLVAGFSANATGMLEMALWRFTATGAPDSTFNGSGHVTHPGAGGGASDEQTIGTGLAVDSQGRIVVSGYSIGTDKLWGVSVWRFLPTGEPDTTFGGTGFVRVTSPQGGGVRCAVDGDDRVVVAGFAWNGADWDTSVWRFEEDGDLDPTFGGTGQVVSNGAAGGSGEDIAVGMAIDGQGRVVAAGYSTNASGNQDATVWRWDSAGAPDAGFGTSGHVSHDDAAGGSGDDVARELAFDGDGRIVVAGWSPSAAGGDDLAVWRILPGGTLDPSFGGGDGFVTQGGAAGGNGVDVGRGVALDGTGRIVVVGQSANAADDADLVLWRFRADGTPDGSLGGSGFVVLAGTAGGTAGADGGRDVLLDGTGKLVLTGFSTNAAGNRDAAVWRLHP